MPPTDDSLGDGDLSGLHTTHPIRPPPFPISALFPPHSDNSHQPSATPRTEVRSPSTCISDALLGVGIHCVYYDIGVRVPITRYQAWPVLKKRQEGTTKFLRNPRSLSTKLPTCISNIRTAGKVWTWLVESYQPPFMQQLAAPSGSGECCVGWAGLRRR